MRPWQQGATMLEVRGLQAWHGNSHVLRGVDLDVAAGEIVSLLGRNGAGRSTTVKALMGELRAAGSVRLRGEDILGMPSWAIARLGVGCVPEHRDIFPALTVRQNLLLGSKPAPAWQTGAPWTLEEIFRLFPLLGERADVPGGALSGGEQQMLSLCRSMLGNPALLLVDEPTEGLAPQRVEQIGNVLQAIAARGTGVLLVEQKLGIALRISQRVCVMGAGQIVYEGTPAQLRQNDAVRREWLEV